MTGILNFLFVTGLIWNTLLLVAGGLVLLRARDVVQRVLALDLLAALVVSLLALLSYYHHQPYYLDAAVALALLSFVATVAAARYLGSGGPFE
ncbi:monovalent cation/H+ antiporter complex subunit F [Mycobacterium asiaticum]|uniref:monovalent cation/H+ antiporter complex subunit F n=1 Tax=Mycobacterium asiaticum TaxID=1790 RepID=UPI000A7B20DE|nr:monovalent cation/H+ antiporter complex subunit F [Mycobacterium asiaticum]